MQEAIGGVDSIKRNEGLTSLRQPFKGQLPITLADVEGHKCRRIGQLCQLLSNGGHRKLTLDCIAVGRTELDSKSEFGRTIIGEMQSRTGLKERTDSGTSFHRRPTFGRSPTGNCVGHAFGYKDRP